jgi:hypothetical protein
MDQLFTHNSLVKNELLYTTILHTGTKKKPSDFRFNGRINAPYKTAYFDSSVVHYEDGIDHTINSSPCISLHPKIVQQSLGNSQFVRLKIYMAQC